MLLTSLNGKYFPVIGLNVKSNCFYKVCLYCNRKTFISKYWSDIFSHPIKHWAYSCRNVQNKPNGRCLTKCIYWYQYCPTQRLTFLLTQTLNKLWLTLLSTDYVRYFIRQTLDAVLNKLELAFNGSFDWQTDTKN